MLHNCWAIVPVKSLTRAKSRLATVLAPGERARLVIAMLQHTLRVLASVDRVAQVLVVSADAQVGEVAQRFAAQWLPEPRALGLNCSLTRAAAVVQRRGAAGLLILPGDLPNVQPQDIAAVLEAVKTPPVCVIAPDRVRQGTNALLLAPPTLIPFSFGPGSFTQHLTLARQVDIPTVVCCRPGLAADLDLPADLSLAQSLVEVAGI